MAKSAIYTGLSLDQWAEVMGFNLFFFNQFDILSDLARDDYSCNNVWYQHQWQRNYTSREEIASAIVKAEKQLADVLNYYPSPYIIENEVIQYPRPAQKFDPSSFMTARGRWKALALQWQKVQHLGPLQRAEMSADVSVTRSDEDGDSIDETFTLTTSNQYTNANGDTVTVTDPDDVAVYFSDGDRLGQAIDHSWRLRPVRVSINEGANQITVTGHAAQLVKPALLEASNPDALTVGTASNYVTTLDVYHRFFDRDNAGTAFWDERPAWRSAKQAAVNAITFDDHERGIIRPVIRSCYVYQSAPDRVQLTYESGVPLQADGRLPAVFARAIAYLACTHLPALSCGCERADQTIRYWRSPPSDDEFGGARPITADEVQNNPFGVKRGALYAHRMTEPLIYPPVFSV